jgi:hypothetical protein
MFDQAHQADAACFSISTFAPSLACVLTSRRLARALPERPSGGIDAPRAFQAVND